MNLCIPRVKSTIKREYIYDKLSNLQIGKIEKLIEIPLKNDPTYKRILFKLNWNNSDKALELKTQLDKKGLINFVYDSPWYWKIFLSNLKNPKNTNHDNNNFNSLGLIG